MDDETLGNVPQPRDGREVSSELLPSSETATSEDTLDRLIWKELQIKEEKPLVEKARQRDNEAWEKIYKDYWPTVTKSIHSHLRNAAPEQDRKSLRLDDLVEEIAQETLAQAFWSISRYVPEQPLISWLRGIAYRVGSAKCRKLWRECRDVHLETLNSNEEPADADIQELVLQRTILHQALSTLKPEQLHVIVLRFREGLSYQEIEEITGYPKDNAKMFVSRFRDGLQKLIAEHENGTFNKARRRAQQKKPRPSDR